MRVPSTNPITMPFGAVWEPYSTASPHKGTDFSYIPDNTIYAPCDGKVQLVPNNGNDGNGVYMYDPESRYHGMLHTSKYLVSSGAVVKEGQPLAIMGDTGFAEGVHLHWAVKVNNQFIDPMSLIKEGDDMYQGKTAKEWHDLYAAQQINDGDIINGKRASTQIPDYQPTGLEFDYFKSLDHIWNSPTGLLYDTINGMQVQIDKAKTGGATGTLLKPGIYKVGGSPTQAENVAA